MQLQGAVMQASGMQLMPLPCLLVPSALFCRRRCAPSTGPCLTSSWGPLLVSLLRCVVPRCTCAGCAELLRAMYCWTGCVAILEGWQAGIASEAGAGAALPRHALHLACSVCNCQLISPAPPCPHRSHRAVPSARRQPPAVHLHLHRRRGPGAAGAAQRASGRRGGREQPGECEGGAGAGLATGGLGGLPLPSCKLALTELS